MRVKGAGRAARGKDALGGQDAVEMVQGWTSGVGEATTTGDGDREFGLTE